MAFSWTVQVDGQNLSEIVEDGATITYGRRNLQDQPDTPVAIVRLLTRDAYPGAAADYPAFGLGDWASDLSGFDDLFLNVYEGVRSRVDIGVPVVITADTPSGFTDAYADEYAGGVNLTRFTGKVGAIDWSYYFIQLTCVTTSESWARIDVGATGVGETIPVETEAARAIRYADEAGIDLVVDGDPTVDVVLVPEETAAQPLMGHLMELMSQTGGLVFTNREGWVHVRTRAYTPPAADPVVLPSAMQLRDPLTMTLELGMVRNRVTLEYGAAASGESLRPSVTVEDAASIARYGLRDTKVSSPIQELTDATDVATQWLLLTTPQWTMPDAVGVLSLGSDADIAALCGLELGDLVQTPELPLGAPVPDFTSTVLGYQETISRTDWQLELHLSPQLSIPLEGGA